MNAGETRLKICWRFISKQNEQARIQAHYYQPVNGVYTKKEEECRYYIDGKRKHYGIDLVPVLNMVVSIIVAKKPVISRHLLI